MRPSLPSPASRILAAVAAAIGGAAVVGVEQSHGSTVYHGPGTGTAHQLQPGLAVIATPGSISPLDRSAPANLVINGDFTDNGRGNTTGYRWSPRSTNSLGGVQLVSVPTATSPPTTSIPGWTFTGGGSNTYALWLPGTTAPVGPWSNGQDNFGPFGSKGSASLPHIYFGNDEGWSISPAANSAGFTTQKVTQTAITWTAPNQSRNFVDGIAPTAAQTVATTSGGTYCLSYWVGHESSPPSAPFGIARLQIAGYNDVFFQVTPGYAAGERWYTFQFDATSSATRIAFTSWGHIGSGGAKTTELVLDDVVVNSCEASASQPEPSNPTNPSNPTSPTSPMASGTKPVPGANSGAVVGVGDLVWSDTNRNGIQDLGENPIYGAAVVLLNVDGTRARNANGKVARAQRTDARGRYFFSNLQPGRYRIQFTYPRGYTATTPGRGSNRRTDSNAVAQQSPNVARTPVFTVAGTAAGMTTKMSGQAKARFANLSIDAGAVPPSARAGGWPVTG